MKLVSFVNFVVYLPRPTVLIALSLLVFCVCVGHHHIGFGAKRRPGFCTETIVVKVNTSKGWDDEDSQKSLCQQVSESTEHHINPLDHAKGVVDDDDDVACHGSLSTQIAGGSDGRRVKSMALFGLSTGNLLLAGAKRSGFCEFDTKADDVLWVVVEVHCHGIEAHQPTNLPSTHQGAGTCVFVCVCGLPGLAGKD